MKNKPYIALLGIVLIFSACDKENVPYTSIKDVENLIYLEIKDFRINEGLNGPFVHQVLMIQEAQKYSYKMANGMIEMGPQGIDEHWETLSEYWTFYNRNVLVLKTMENSEELILDELLATEGIESALLGDYSQCGVGVEQDQEGFNYVTILLAKAD